MRKMKEKKMMIAARFDNREGGNADWTKGD